MTDHAELDDLRDLPHSDEIEAACLKAIMDRDARPADPPLAAGDFYREAHRIIFRATETLRERGAGIDALTVAEELKRTGELAKFMSSSPDWRGEMLFVSTLLDGASASRNVSEYGRILRGYRQRRNAIGKVATLSGALWNGHSDAEVSPLVDELTAAWAEPEAEMVKLEPLRFGDFDVTAPPPVAFGEASGDAAFAAGDLILDAGDSGAGKSLGLLDLGLAWCTGGKWLSFPPGDVAGSVLFVTSDGDGADPVRARVVRLGAGRGLTPRQLDRLDLHVIPADGFDLDTPASFASLQRAIAERDPGLIVAETLSSLMGPERDPFNPGSVADFIGRRLRPLQLRPDGSRRTLHVSHHLRKKASTPGANALRDRVAGSYRMVGGVDSVVAWEPAGERAFNLRLVKPSRWGLRFRAFNVVIDGDPPGPLVLKNTGHLDQTTSEQAADDTRFYAALQALDGPEGWARLADIKARAGIEPTDKRAAKRFERAGRRLAKAGTIEAHPKRGACYRLPRGEGSLPLEEDPDA